MSSHDTQRRVYGYRSIGRVNNGQDQFDKEALQGVEGGEIAEVRRTRQSGVSANTPTGKSRFSVALDRWRGDEKKK